MVDKTNYDLFLKSYQNALKSLAEGNLKKAHRHVLKAMDYHHLYLDETEGLERLKGVKFNKSIHALEANLSQKLNSINVLSRKVESDDILTGIAGQQRVKDELRRLVIYPQLYPDLYVKFKKHSGGGILLYGVPGTGKTRIAQQVAKELDCHFMELKCSNVISKWFGDTEKNLKEIFKEARSHDRTIIFFDEFEALGAVRGKETNSPIGRVVSELLSQMQGFEENSNIIFMAATNRPWDVDPAFLRPGRFNSIIMVDLPDRNARREIVESELDPSMLASDFNIDKLVELTEGFSAADMVEFCERLKDQAIWRIIKTKTNSLISDADVLTIKANINTSVNANELKRIRDYKATH